MSGIKMYWLGRLCLMMLWSWQNNISKTDSILPSISLKFHGALISLPTNVIPHELHTSRHGLHAILKPRQGLEFGGSSNLALRHRASTLRFVGRSSGFDSIRWVVFGTSPVHCDTINCLNLTIGFFLFILKNWGNSEKLIFKKKENSLSSLSILW